MRGGIKLVRSTKQLQAIKQLGNTIYLRKNIEQITVADEFTGESHQEWQADEVNFDLDELTKEVTLAEIENNFSIYFDWAKQLRQSEQKQKQKAKEVRELVDDLKLADLKLDNENTAMLITMLMSEIDTLRDRITTLEGGA